jgi:hypothetical protein
MKDVNEGLEKYKFEFPSIEIPNSIDPHGFRLGKIVLERSSFIKKWTQKILMIESYSQHYWRAPKGSGKTMFLFLLGQELQKKVWSFTILKAERVYLI